MLDNRGRFILNISDHIRKGKVVPVAEWHKETLENLGFSMEYLISVETPRHRFGANNDVRVVFEHIMVFRLDKRT